MEKDQWRVVLSDTWDVLGPFPIHAREQYFISPAYPIDLSKPIDYSRTWPSSYADGGKVGWTRVHSDPDGSLKVSFPSIRWEALRSTEGWAALQHHAVLHSTLFVYPPDEYRGHAPPHLLVRLLQGSFFTILSTHPNSSRLPRWYNGNIYDISNALPNVVPLPDGDFPSDQGLAPFSYDIFISGDYEIRLFGDPHVQGSQVPVQQLRLDIRFDDAEKPIVKEPSRDIICDFVNGKALGNAIGVGVRVSSASPSSSGWTAEDVQPLGSAVGKVQLHLHKAPRVAISQSRVVPILIASLGEFWENELSLALRFRCSTGSSCETIIVSIRIRQVANWPSPSRLPAKATYFYAQSIPTAFLVIPPLSKVPHPLISAVIALHGAGVDVLDQNFWADALPRQKDLWYVIPTGRTSWGLDWHGPSTEDAWEALRNLGCILDSRTEWAIWRPDTEKPVILLGHSNGGQGTWHISTHFPDRVRGIIPAAAYIKSQAYVPLTMSRSSHFVDPMLLATLETALTIDDNDLHLSNLKYTQVLAIHGGSDENVPVWHSRELVSTLLSRGISARFHEEPGAGHWYPSVFYNDDVNEFFRSMANVSQEDLGGGRSFVLTVTNPSEYGAMQGFRIEHVLVPGRLATLQVQSQNEVNLRILTCNVRRFSIRLLSRRPDTLSINNQMVQYSVIREGVAHFEIMEGLWKEVPASDHIHPPLRLQAILRSPAPITFVTEDNNSQAFSIALRLSQDLSTYHQLDSEVTSSSKLLTDTPGDIPNGNIVYIGRPQDAFVQRTLSPAKTAFIIASNGGIEISGIPASGAGLATAFLHPHPASPRAVILFLLATDEDDLERIVRLFPIRTGIPVPSWIIVGSGADSFGTAGVRGAGLWDYNWQYHPVSSWVAN